MSADDLIAACLEEAAKTMNNALGLYWCGYQGKDKPNDPKDNDISERNTSFHFAHALANKGLLVYAEVGHNTRTNSRGALDYFAISPKNFSIGIEAKKICKTDKFSEIHSDIQRISHFSVQLASDYSGEPPKARFGVVLGTTWNSSFKRAWLGEDSGIGAKSWTDLDMAFQENHAKRVALVIADERNGYKDSICWLLAASFACKK